MLGLSRTNGKVVGVQGFEPWTPCSQSRCATRLRYTPTESIFYTDEAIWGKSCKIRDMVAYFPSKYPRRLLAAFSVALLLFCLLGTHWVGFAHGISHAGLHSSNIEQCSATDADTTAGVTHGSDACHLYDALTLAGFIASDTATQLNIASSIAVFKVSSNSPPAQIHIGLYQPRAPPTFIL